MQITVERFDFEKLIMSHGWVFLAPFSWDENRHVLSRPLATVSGRSVPVSISAKNHGARTTIRIRVPNDSQLNKKDSLLLRSQIRRMLCLDFDYTPFHVICRAHQHLQYVADQGCGGMLRSPTAIVEAGQPGLKAAGPFGYRAATLLNIASLAINNCLPLDDLSAVGDYEAIRTALTAIHGVGPYCIRHMLVLLGEFDEIPVDSEVTKYVSNRYFGGEDIDDRQAQQTFADFDPYQFLAYKFTRMHERLNYIDK
jgi:hypothetical protein